MKQHIIFQGDAQILLYGNNALVPLSLSKQSLISAIGFENSELIVNEHREHTIQSLENTSNSHIPDNFTEIFNRPARVEVSYIPNNHSLTINLFKALGDTNLPILWMGVLENNVMPAYEIDWEIFKPVDENNMAFCALISNQS